MSYTKCGCKEHKQRTSVLHILLWAWIRGLRVSHAKLYRGSGIAQRCSCTWPLQLNMWGAAFN
jgi:hypothetical protein